MDPRKASSEAQFMEALALASAAALRGGGRDALAEGLLNSAVRPGAAIACALLAPAPGGSPGWLKSGFGAPVIRIHPGAALPREQVQRGAPRLLEGPQVCDWLFRFTSHAAHAVEAPLQAPGHRPGSLVLAFPGTQDQLSEPEKRFSSALADLALLGLDRIRSARRLRQVATRDDLTDALNFRYLKTALRKEIESAARTRRPLSIIMLDVDHLKRYNERFGHIRGSELLRDLSQVVLRELPRGCKLAKYGGDEFVIILAGRGHEEALEVGEVVRRGVAGHAFELAEAGEVTASFGVAAYPQNGATSREILEAADRALFWAKNSGRNRLQVAV